MKVEGGKVMTTMYLISKVGTFQSQFKIQFVKKYTYRSGLHILFLKAKGKNIHARNVKDN